MVVEGPAGIGKTELLAAARGARARAPGCTPLTARGTELERAFGFGVVRQLFEPLVAGRRPAPFEGAARRAAALLDVELAEPAFLPLGPEGSFAALHGLYRLTANLARRAPLALLVDDAHWADGASLRFLAYLGNRLERVPVLLVRRRAAARRARRRRRRRARSPRARRCCARSALSERRVGASSCAPPSPTPPAPLCRTCHELTGGNPFFLRELADALRDAGAERAGDVLGAAPEGVVASVRARLARFPPAGAGARRRGRDRGRRRAGPPRRRARRTSTTGEAAEAADTLRAGRILADTRALRFVHPIIRSAVYEQLPPGRAVGRPRARGAHARRARTRPPSGRRASARDRAARLEWVCDRLRDAAREAVPRGAPDAVRHLPAARARGAAVGPPSRPATLLELGLAESLTLDREPAIEHLRRGVETTQGHRRAALRGAHARSDGRHGQPDAARSRSWSARWPPAPTPTRPWPCTSRATC